jgi:hypothetical protein
MVMQVPARVVVREAGVTTGGQPRAGRTVDVLAAGYLDLEAARLGFAALCDLVRDGRVATGYGVILVAKDRDGTVTLAGASDHTGRPGLRWDSGVGLVVGLFSPPMLASIVTGGGAGGFAGHDSGGGGRNLGGKLAPGGAAVIAVIGGGRPAAEKALGGSLSASVIPMDGQNLAQLRDSLAEVMGDITPGLPVRPRAPWPAPLAWGPGPAGGG